MKPHIKNLLMIDVDTERAKPILFAKPPGTTQPTTQEEAAKFILLDIACLAEAITTLIHMAGEQKYGDKTELINATIKTLYGALETPDNTPTETPEENGY